MEPVITVIRVTKRISTRQKVKSMPSRNKPTPASVFQMEDGCDPSVKTIISLAEQGETDVVRIKVRKIVKGNLNT